MIVLILIILGILLGGVVNVLADDLPRRRNPGLPKYPDGTVRPVIAWLGITAFLTGKRTAPNGATLTWRYPLTEIATALLMVLTYVTTQNAPGTSQLQLIFWLIYMPIFVLITVIDLEHKLILFVVMIPSGILALAVSILANNAYIPKPQDALLGGLMGFGIFFIIYLGGVLFTYLQGIDEVAFGFGDVMLGTVAGLMVGWGDMILVLFISVLAGAFGALLYLVGRQLRARGYVWFTALPYGPYIVVGTLIMLLFKAQAQYMLIGFCTPSPPLVC